MIEEHSYFSIRLVLHYALNVCKSTFCLQDTMDRVTLVLLHLLDILILTHNLVSYVTLLLNI